MNWPAGVNVGLPGDIANDAVYAVLKRDGGDAPGSARHKATLAPPEGSSRTRARPSPDVPPVISTWIGCMSVCMCALLLAIDDAECRQVGRWIGPSLVAHSYKNPDVGRAARGVSAVILAKAGI